MKNLPAADTMKNKLLAALERYGNSPRSIEDTLKLYEDMVIATIDFQKNLKTEENVSSDHLNMVQKINLIGIQLVQGLKELYDLRCNTNPTDDELKPFMEMDLPKKAELYKRGIRFIITRF